VSVRGNRLPLFLLSVALLGCGPGIRTPEIQLRSVSAKSAREAVASLAIYNPNRFPLRVQSVDYQVSIAGEIFGRGRRSEPLLLDARDTTNAEFDMSLDWGEIAKAVPSMLKDSVAVGLEGSYVAATIFGRRRFGFKGERTISLKDEVKSFIENLFQQH